MAKNEKLYLTKQQRLVSVTLTNSDGTTPKELVAGGADDSIIKALFITSDDSTARDVLLFHRSGSTNYNLGHVDVPVGSGTDGSTSMVNGLNATNLPALPTDAQGNRYIPVQYGASIYVGMLTTVTSGKTVTVTAVVEDF